jgi:hypothetical protein
LLSSDLKGIGGKIMSKECTRRIVSESLFSRYDWKNNVDEGTGKIILVEITAALSVELG